MNLINKNQLLVPADMDTAIYDPTNVGADAFDYNNFFNVPFLAAVATSGDYFDLSNAPSIDESMGTMRFPNYHDTRDDTMAFFPLNFLYTDTTGHLYSAPLQDIITSANIVSALGYTPEDPANKGAANGYAPLNSSSIIDSMYLPAFTGIVYKGDWNATANTPTLTSGTGTVGDMYFVNVAGTHTLDGISSWSIGDQLIFGDDNIWHKTPNYSAVVSVNGAIGVVLLGLADMADTIITTPINGNFVRYNGTKWVNDLIGVGDVPNLPWSKITSGTPTTLVGYGIADGVSTGSSYVDPSWLVSLAGSKITGLSVVATTGAYSDLSGIPTTDLGISSVQYTTPISGNVINSDGSEQLIVNPAGALLALTVNFPSSPTNGKRFSFSSTKAITTLTLGGGTILGPLTSVAINGFASWIYSSSASEWVRCG